MALFTALIAGLVFGIGLLLSGMANPSKVLNFLDITGAWDPSMGLVMAGAIAATLPAFWWLRKKGRSFLTLPLQWPTNTTIDARLIMGSALFGIGWGLVGYCPGPALVSLIITTEPAAIFVAAMVAGMALFTLYEHIRA